MILRGYITTFASLSIILIALAQNVQGRRKQPLLKVVSILDSPFIMLRKGANRTAPGNRRYEGFIPDLLREIEHVTGREYEIYLSPDGKYGSQEKKNGKWNGMIGEVISGAADFSAASLTVTSTRSRAVDFSIPFMNTGVQILYKKPERSTASITMFSPLAAEVWICIIGIFIMSGLGMYLLQRCVPASLSDLEDDRFEACKLGDSFWLLIRSFTLQGFDGSSVPSWSGRVLLGSWLLFSFLTLIMYGAALITWVPAIIGGILQSLPFTDVESLLESNVKFGCVSGGSTRNFFKLSDVTAYENMYFRMEKDNSYVKSVSEGVQLARQGNFAFLGESQALEYAATRRPCDLLVVGQQITSNAYAMATRLNSDFKNILDQAILQLRETGAIKRLTNKWWYDVSPCPRPDEAIAAALGSGEDEGNVERLNLQRFLTAGPVLIFGAGLFLAVLTGSAEVVWSKRSAMDQPLRKGGINRDIVV